MVTFFLACRSHKSVLQRFVAIKLLESLLVAVKHVGNRKEVKEVRLKCFRDVVSEDVGACFNLVVDY